MTIMTAFRSLLAMLHRSLEITYIFVNNLSTRLIWLLSDIYATSKLQG